MPTTTPLRIRPLTRHEFDQVIDWAASEGWNPGLSDATAFWETDPEGFVGAEYRGELIGSGSIVSYNRAFGFMGFFMIRPEFRGQGLGAQLWHERVRLLRQRLAPAAPIGMDGVFAMQPFYKSGGFAFHHRSPRMEGIATKGKPCPQLVELSSLPFEQVSRFDQTHFGYERNRFLTHWIAPKNGLALGLLQNDKLAGMGVIRPCQSGWKIGPLFANSPDAAETIFDALASHVAGERIYLDTPENNPAAQELARNKGLREVFGCARMYQGAAPVLPHTQIYGITTFELG